MVKWTATVLIVDDDAETTTMFGYYLQRKGYNVQTAARVSEAMPLVNGDTPPDVLILDVMLPGASGLELLTHIRSTPAIAHIHVILLSAHALQPEARPDGVQPDQVLQKPVRIADLQAALYAALAR